MSLDLFISHASEDSDVAKAMCGVLEGTGLRCWMAPRDIVAGSTYGSSIVGAIARARVAAIIVSAKANASSHVIKEVERAVARRIPVIPFRVEEVLPTGDLEYFLAAAHWLDATSPPLELHLLTLAEAVRSLLSSATPVPRARVSDDRGAARMFEEVAPDAWRWRRSSRLTRWLQSMFSEK